MDGVQQAVGRCQITGLSLFSHFLHQLQGNLMGNLDLFQRHMCGCFHAQENQALGWCFGETQPKRLQFKHPICPTLTCLPQPHCLNETQVVGYFGFTKLIQNRFGSRHLSG